jgi:hypothetical protein
MIDPMLEARVMNRLQERKRGQTIEQLQEHTKATQGQILTVLEVYAKENLVSVSNGVWTLVREKTK